MKERQPLYGRIDRRRTVQGINVPPECSDEEQVDWALIHERESTHRKRRRAADEAVAARFAASQAKREQKS